MFLINVVVFFAFMHCTDISHQGYELWIWVKVRKRERAMRIKPLHFDHKHNYMLAYSCALKSNKRNKKTKYTKMRKMREIYIGEWGGERKEKLLKQK